MIKALANQSVLSKPQPMAEYRPFAVPVPNIRRHAIDWVVHLDVGKQKVCELGVTMWAGLSASRLR